MTEPGQIITASHGEEGGHYYDAATGQAAYTIVGKNGKERNVTLADAKRLRPKTILVPGVTTILKMADKPALLNYIKRQVLLAALTLPKIDGEPEDAWVDRVMADADEHRIKAAERGTLIHAWIQQGFEGKSLPEDGRIYYHAANVELLRHGLDGQWECERTFAKDGYGGKVDLWLWPLIPNTIIDIKTTDKPLDGLKTWDDHAEQLAAYRRGLNDPAAECGILFVSTKDVAARLVMIPEEQLVRGERMFEALKSYFYAKTGLTFEATPMP